MVNFAPCCKLTRLGTVRHTLALRTSPVTKTWYTCRKVFLRLLVGCTFEHV